VRQARSFETLEALAIHNEREGVVGETWGALVATFQAERAGDVEVRKAMRVIAREELAHAALSLRVASWSRRRLSPNARAKVDAERARAIARIARTSDGFAGRDEGNPLGWPSERERQALVAELASLLA
jgi:hypothetical protein